MNSDSWSRLIEWAVGLVLIAIAGVLRLQDNRLRIVETTVESKDEADKQRAALRDDLHEFREETQRGIAALRLEAHDKQASAAHELKNFRAEISNRLEVVRIETNTKLEKLSDQVGEIAQHLNGKPRRAK